MIVQIINNMDTEKLILGVKERKSLWDPTHKQYHNRDYTRQTWAGLAEEMEESSVFLKGKWLGLRDTYRKELVKTNKQTDESGLTKYTSKWRYFETMAFLKDTMTHRAGNLFHQETVENLYDNESSASESEGTPSDPLIMKLEFEEISNDISQSTTCDNSKRRKIDNSTSQLSSEKRQRISIYDRIKAVEEKLETIKEKAVEKARDHDEDFYFLMSLLPHLKSVPDEKKLMVRMKIQQILLEEQPYFQKDDE